MTNNHRLIDRLTADGILELVENRLVHTEDTSFPQQGPLKTAVGRIVRNLDTAAAALGKEHPELAAAIERAFTLAEFCRYEPGRITTPPDAETAE